MVVPQALMQLPKPALPTPPPAKKPRIEDDDLCGDVLAIDSKDTVAATPATSSSCAASSLCEFAGEMNTGRRYPKEILGCRVTMTAAYRKGKWNYNDRLEVTCPNRLHLGCSHSRSVELDSDVFGPRCAEYWLGAWLEKSDSLSAREHKQYRPIRSHVDAYASSPNCPPTTL